MTMAWVRRELGINPRTRTRTLPSLPPATWRDWSVNGMAWQAGSWLGVMAAAGGGVALKGMEPRTVPPPVRGGAAGSTAAGRGAVVSEGAEVTGVRSEDEESCLQADRATSPTVPSTEIPNVRHIM